MSKITNRLLFTILLFLPIFIFAQNLEEKVTVHKLNNGLTVIFVERHEAPVFTAVYGFKVGSVDELPGITGVAHIFEHMAFKGTQKIGTTDYEKEKPIMEQLNKLGRDISIELGKGKAADMEKVKTMRAEFAKLDKEQKKFIVKDEIWSIYNNEGGVGLNASTGTDVTQYVISLPKNKFELYCLMESERMKNAVLREFYTERSVIQEERKQTTEAVPTRQIDELFTSAAFIAHPYKNPVVGWASDINSVTLEEALNFKNKYYTPNNCVLTVVGDINPKEAIPVVEKYFADFQKGPELPLFRTVEPKQVGERRIKAELNAEPMILMGYHKPTFPDRDDAVMSVIISLLNQRSARLYKDLIKEKQIATNIRIGSSPGNRYDNLLTVQATPRFPHTNEELEKAIIEHLNKLKTEPVSDQELLKIKNNLDASYIRSLASNMGLCYTLLRYQLFFGDWKLFLKQREILKTVTAQEIMDCAKKYFNDDNKTVAYLIKKSK